MKFKERTFPHPVLDPTGKDITGSAFQVTCKVTSDNTFVYVNVSFALSNNTLSELVTTNKAKFVVHADCNAAFFRKPYTFNEVEGRIRIPMTDVKRLVDLTFFICATEPIEEYTVEGMDAVYNGAVFKIYAGDILAYSEPISINIFDKDSLSKISSIMLVREGDSELTVPSIDFNEDKIAVSLPPSQFALYGSLKVDHRIKATLLNAVVLPVLIEAVREVLNPVDDDNDLSLYTWYRVLQHKIAELKKKPGANEESAYYLAQSILAGVSEKALKEIDEILTPSE
ncbi:MAG: hypothetical protein LH609_15270 [Rudanella sp.]|nr:hypothetical protein [Rudanella sp.]